MASTGNNYLRKLSTVRAEEIKEQGRKAFMGMFDICPFKDFIETKLWTQGYTEAKIKWNRENPQKVFKPRNNNTHRGNYGKNTR